ncbi:hypothetical protein, partial [Paenibacillus solani]|uniref:hypothetical protein n=1 Tax=Paenibacillus solani TaxID=1705565 RepID=UPI001A942824
LWLTVPTAKPVADFHRQVIAHAGRTYKKDGADLFCTVFLSSMAHFRGAIPFTSLLRFQALP